jgi:hypothetical protein
MAHPSSSPTGNHGIDSQLRHTSSTASRRGPRESIDIQIPLQLFQATGHGGSLRDKRGSLSWIPQPALPYTADGSLNDTARRITHTSDELEPAISSLSRTRQSDNFGSQDFAQRNTEAPAEGDTTTPAALSVVNEGSRPNSERRLSFETGAEDILSRTPKGSRPTTRYGTTAAPSIWSTTDPFSTSKDSFSDNGAETTLSSQAPRKSLPYSPGNEDISPESPPRRGTMQSIVDTVVPDAVHRRFTNASHIRKSSMWQLYEQAKERGVELQRHRSVQLAFEFGIYAILICIIYFVLIGVPLWNGVVWWLWWVVAHKFVIAGGFSITLGIALL